MIALRNARQVVGKYNGEDIEVEFGAVQVVDDYGVPGSPTFWSLEWDTVEIRSLTILGCDVSPAALPGPLVAVIYSLSEEVDFEAAE